MHKIFQNVFKKIGLSFYGRLEPKLRGISESKLKFSTFLIKRKRKNSIKKSTKFVAANLVFIKG